MKKRDTIYFIVPISFTYDKEVMSKKEALKEIRDTIKFDFLMAGSGGGFEYKNKRPKFSKK